MDHKSLVTVAEALLEDVKSLETANEKESKQARGAIMRSANTLMLETCDPIEHMKSEWFKLGEVAAWNIFKEWKVFDNIPDSGSISYKEIAEGIDAEEFLVSRIGAMLVASGKLVQPEPGYVQHSRLSRIYRSDALSAAPIWLAIAMGMKPFTHWPEYFETYGRKTSQTQNHTPSAFAWGHPELTIWDIIGKNPEHKRKFAASMKAQSIRHTEVVGPTAVYDLSWVEEEAKVRSKTDLPLLVDVGGGHGQLLEEIIGAFPGIPPERCVLQDRAEVVEEARSIADPTTKGVVQMAHDFHTEQPVPGALVYLLRRVLLDWSDEACIGILSHLARALPDDPKARILIIEPHKLEPPVSQSAFVDLVMLNLGGKLRDEKMMAAIVTAAGLKIVKVHWQAGDEGHVVECVKA